MIKVKQNPQVNSKFESYPKEIQEKLNHLRDLILEVASNIDHLEEIEETLKWGEPSYIAKKGSTIRMDWKPKAPDQYAMYFNCNTSLVETFRILYGDQFAYQKNRALVFDLEGEIPEKELKACIEMALEYHLIKDKPLLGR